MGVGVGGQRLGWGDVGVRSGIMQSGGSEMSEMWPQRWGSEVRAWVLV